LTVDKAEGVFIWIRVVVDELLEGLCEGYTITELKDVLESLPSEMNDLYKSTISRSYRRQFSRKLDADHRREAYVTLQVALSSRWPLTLRNFIHICRSIATGSVTGENIEIDLHSDELKRRLHSRTGGLLEAVARAVKRANDPFADAGNHVDYWNIISAKNREDIVQFIHRSAKDFVECGYVLEALSLSPDASISDQKSVVGRNGHDLLFDYCIRQFPRHVLDSDLFYHAWRAETITGFHNSERWRILTSQHNLNLELLDPFRQAKSPLASTELRFLLQGIMTPEQRLLIMAVFCELRHYVQWWLTKKENSPGEDLSARLLCAAILAACLPWAESGKVGNTEMLRLAGEWLENEFSV
jgi:hypothetical protein